MSMLFALVLLGCADDGTQCERLATQPEQYASKTLCEAGQEGALKSDVALRADYPLVITRCVKSNGTLTYGGWSAKLAVRAE